MRIDPLVASTTAAGTFAAVLVVALVAGTLHVRRLRRALQRTRDRHRRSLRRDPLTGVATRAVLRDRLEQLDGSDGYTVVVVDLDRFALVNDAHGEQVGDVVLTEVARRIARLAAASDVVGRLDGDAFAVVRAGRTAEAEIGRFVESVLVAVRTPVVLPGGVELSVEATAGRACATAGMRPLAVVRAAEQNMLAARRSRTALDRAIDARLGPRSAGTLGGPVTAGSVELPVRRRLTVPSQPVAATAETLLVRR